MTSRYSSPVDRLLTLGFANEPKWQGYNYRKLRMTAADLPALSAMLDDEELLFDDTTIAGSAIVHACAVMRAIGDARAIPALIKLLRRTDDDRLAFVGEFLPNVIIGFGGPAIGPTAELARDQGAAVWPRTFAIDILAGIGRKFRDQRNRCVTLLAEMLNDAAKLPIHVLQAVVVGLLQLRAVEHADQLKSIYDMYDLDEMHVGTWQQAKEDLGLAPKTPIVPLSDDEMIARLDKMMARLKKDQK